MPFEIFELQEQDESEEFHNAYLEFMQQNNTFDDFIGRKKEKAAKKKAEGTLNAFIDEDLNGDTDRSTTEEFGDESFIPTDSFEGESEQSEENPKKKKRRTNS